jgi:hypothetical protein
LRRFVVDVDTQLVAILYLQYNPRFSHGPAATSISSEGTTSRKRLVHKILGLLGFNIPISLHVIIPHPQSL